MWCKTPGIGKGFAALIGLAAVCWLCLPQEEVAARSKPPVFLESDGLVVIEAESTTSPPGKWEGKQEVQGFTGKGHIEFTGNAPAGGPANSPLAYVFRIDKPGSYTLHLRCHKRLEGEKKDKCNDAYVRVLGEYDASPDAEDKNKADATLDILRQDTKLFGGSQEGWGWAETLDLGNHNFRVPKYVFKKGGRYALVITGRSQRFNIDRIVFRHESVAKKKMMDPDLEESAREGQAPRGEQ